MVALVLSWERVVGHRGALGALEVLSGSRKEDEEEGRLRNQVEAWEEALSYPEAQGDLRKRTQEGQDMVCILYCTIWDHSRMLSQ